MKKIRRLRSGWLNEWTIAFFIYSGLGFGQSRLKPSFTDAAAKLTDNTFYSWLQKAVADMNADGKDDIIVANQLGEFFILYQQPNGTFISRALGKVQPYTPLSIIVADIDNNGYNDILTGGEYNGVRIVKANYNATNYSITRLPQDSIFTQASALADINNDGWLDAFVCNDDSTNAIWSNDKAGNLFRDITLFDFSSVPLNRQSGNYGIVFTDVDNDGNLDAYLSKCSRWAMNDPADQRRINQLFVKNKGVYSDQAKAWGMADSSQTWVTEFQDIDNDGDMDAFIANHYTPSRLMLNDGTGKFKDITAESGLLGATPEGILQALMRDFDNDGYVDLLVSGMKGANFFQNNGNNTFRAVDLPLLNKDADSPLRSFVVGDLNHDGFLDIYGSYFFGDTNDTDQLWINDRNDNHFIAISLIGTQSNRSAVGARITLTAGGKTYIREVRAGESYGISNTLTQHIGLGGTTQIDTLEIRWPSGQRSVVDAPTTNQFLTLVEPLCQGVHKCTPISFKIIK